MPCRSTLLVLAGQIDCARDVGERAVEAGERAGNHYARCQGLETLALVALAEGFVGDSVARPPSSRYSHRQRSSLGRLRGPARGKAPR